MTTPVERRGKALKVLFSRDDEAHTRGYYVIATALRDAGIEVILGGTQEPAQLAITATQEDVDVIGYRIMSGEPTILISRLLEQLESRGADDIPILLGGIIPPPQVAELKAKGVREIFMPGARLDSVVEAFVRNRRVAPPVV